MTQIGNELGVPQQRDGSAPVERQLRDFTGEGYDKGRNVLWQAVWFATMNLVFMKWWLPPRLRPWILRAFGAKIGKRVLIRHRVRVQWPWKLEIGDDCWIGEGAWLMNLEPITIEHDVCISQEALLCTGSHRHTDPRFKFDNSPINVGAGSWVTARAVVLRGSSIRAGQLLPAGSVHVGDQTGAMTAKRRTSTLPPEGEDLGLD